MANDFTYLGNPNLKRANVQQQWTKKQLQEYARCNDDQKDMPCCETIRNFILIRPGRQVLWPRAPLCLGPQELIWLLVLVLLLLMLLFLLQVQRHLGSRFKNILAEGSKAQKYLSHRRRMPRTL